MKLIATAALFVAVFAGCGTEPAKTSHEAVAAEMKVALQRVERVSVVAIEEMPGTVRSRLRSTIEAKVSGKVERIHAEPGRAVCKGEPLVTLDSAEINARLNQAKTERDQLAKDTARFRELFDKHAVSRQDFERTETRYQVAVAAAQEAETMLGYTIIVAPFDGVIVRKLADVGDLAGPGKPLLQIENPDELRFELNIPESLVDRISLGQTISVLLSGKAEAATAKVSEVAPEADPSSRTFLTKVDLPRDSKARSGMFARALIPTGKYDALRAPSSAVLKRGQLEIVFVEVDGVARMRLVKTGRAEGGVVEIASGLAEGERVILDPPVTLREGQRVGAGT